MQKLKHIKYTKLSPILSETIPSPAESPFCRTSTRAASAGDFSFLLIDLFFGSRHLVIDRGLLGNRM
jgi:hypothetical protein